MTNLRLAVRTLFKTPFVTAVAVVSLALGIGANAAIFSLFDQLLLKPVPVPAPDRLVNLLAPGPKPGSNSCNNQSTRRNCDDVFSYPMYQDLARVQTVFTGIATHRVFDASLSYRGQTLNGDGVLVSGNYFSVLGLAPSLGRLISPGDDSAPGESHVVVLTHRYWRERFGAAPEVINQTMLVNGQPMTIVGVGPAGFDGATIGVEAKVFVPITMRALMEPSWKGFDDRRSYSFYLFARLKPGVTRAQAAASIGIQYHAIINDVEAPLQRGMSDQTMARFRARELLIEPGSRGQSSLPSRAGPSMKVLLGVTAFVVVIACANIANLLLARSAARGGEMAVRLSIGAARRHLIGQLLTESCVLALLGGAASLLVAQATLTAIHSMLPEFAAQGFDWSIDWTVLAFTAALAIGTGLAFGLFPAFYSTRVDLASILKGEAGQASGGRGAARFRMSLATVQLALSITLLVAAGLFTRSLMNVSRVNLGVDADRVVTFQIAPSLSGYTPDRTGQVYRDLEDRLAALPGVTGVTESMVAILSGNNWGNSLTVEGFPSGPDTDTGSRVNEVGPGYLNTLRIPLLAGREFSRADGAEAPKVAIVNQAFARKFNLGPNPVGRHLGEGGRSSKLDTEIVGLAQDAVYSEVKDSVPPVYLRPYPQGQALKVGYMTFYVRSALNASDTIATIRKSIAAIDPGLPVENLRTLPEQVRQNVFFDRLISVLSVGFASLATLLAAIGLYGVLAYTVAQRQREIGVRMALGATPGRVRAMILGDVARMVAVGVPLGLVAAVSIGRLGESLLFQLKGSDPVVLGAAVVLLAAVAFGAGLVPAARASRIEPMQALRYE